MEIIGIVDYGVGNVRSIQNMLWKIDIRSELISSNKDLINTLSKNHFSI